jgi:hypothetical protein
MPSDPEKSGDTILFLHQALNGGIINSADLARRMAELIFGAMEPDSALADHQPFAIEDQGDAWRVTTNPAAPPPRERLTPWEIIIKKRDARIVTLGRKERWPITPEMLRPTGESA